MRNSIDFGTSKIEIAALGDNGGMVVRRRMPTLVRYKDAIAVLVRLVGRPTRRLVEWPQ